MNKLYIIILFSLFAVQCNDKDEQGALYEYGVPVYGISLDKDNVTLDLSESVTLVATIKPDDARDPNVLWSGKYDSIATVDANGKVLPKDIGETEIYATASDGGYKAITVITVITDFAAMIKGDYAGKVSGNQMSQDVAVLLDEAQKNVVTVDLSGITILNAPGSVRSTVSFGSDKNFHITGEEVFRDEGNKEIAIVKIEGSIPRGGNTLALEIIYTDLEQSTKTTYEFEGVN